MNNKFIVAVVIIIVIAIVGAYQFPKSTSVVEKVIKSVGAVVSPDIYDAVRFHNSVTYNPISFATTTTGSSATLVQNDLIHSQYTMVTMGGAQDTDFTYTLPATSTLQNFVPHVGSRTEVCWFNVASSTSVHDLIIAAGTGWDLAYATSTLPVPLGVKEDNLLCVEAVRQGRSGSSTTVTGDITGILKLYDDAD